MCVASEQEFDQTVMSGSTGGNMEYVSVVAPRLGLDYDVYERIDWDEVQAAALIGAAAGSATGTVQGVVGGAVGAALQSIESQEDVDLEDLVDVKNDLLIISGSPMPYLPMY